MHGTKRKAEEQKHHSFPMSHLSGPLAHQTLPLRLTPNTYKIPVRIDPKRSQTTSSMTSDNMKGASRTEKELRIRKKKEHRDPHVPHFVLEPNVHDYDGDKKKQDRNGSKRKRKK